MIQNNNTNNTSKNINSIIIQNIYKILTIKIALITKKIEQNIIYLAIYKFHNFNIPDYTLWWLCSYEIISLVTADLYKIEVFYFLWKIYSLLTAEFSQGYTLNSQKFLFWTHWILKGCMKLSLGTLTLQFDVWLRKSTPYHPPKPDGKRNNNKLFRLTYIYSTLL